MRWFAVIALLVLAVNLCYGEMFVGSQASYFEPDDDNFKRDNMTHLGQSVEVGYLFNDYFEVLGIVAHQRFNSAWDSRFDEIILLGAARAKYPVTKKLSAYFTAGAGESWFVNKRLVGKAVGYEETVKEDNSIAFLYGPGLQYSINKNLKVFIEADYRYSNTGKGSSLDSWGWGYGGGVRWYFD